MSIIDFAGVNISLYAQQTGRERFLEKDLFGKSFGSQNFSKQLVTSYPFVEEYLKISFKSIDVKILHYDSKALVLFHVSRHFSNSLVKKIIKTM